MKKVESKRSSFGKVALVAGAVLLPMLSFAADNSAAIEKITGIANTVITLLAVAAGAWFIIQFILRGMKIAQGEMSARELVPPFVGALVCFLAVVLANTLLDGMDTEYTPTVGN